MKRIIAMLAAAQPRRIAADGHIRFRHEAVGTASLAEEIEKEIVDIDVEGDLL